MKLNLVINLTPRQKMAFKTIETDGIDEILYGGAKGGGKSWFLCEYAQFKALQIIEQCKLKATKDPIPIGFLGRKVGQDFTTTTLNTWYKVANPSLYRIVGKPAVIIILDRVLIYTGGLDRQEAVNKFNSAELAFYGIDQAEETTEDDINVLRAGSHNRLIIDGITFPGKGVFTANPAPCWLKPEFILNPAKNRRFVQALPGDNPYLGEAYINTLKDAFKHRPELLQAYLYGNWDSFEGADQVIKDTWLQAATTRRPAYWPFIKEFITIDCARFGDDETVILLMDNTDIKEKIVMPHCRTTDISGRAAALSRANGNCQIVVEVTGGDLGAGVADELIELGCDVLVYNPQAKAVEKDKYYNVRAEAWSKAAIMLNNGVCDKYSNMSVCITKHVPDSPGNYGMDDTMRGQLCTPHYKFRKGRIIIEKKEDIKKRLGRSPDHADAYVIALWAWPFMNRREEERTTYRRRESVTTAMDM